MAVRGFFSGRLKRRYTAEIVTTRYWERRFRLGDIGNAPVPRDTPPSLISYSETDWTGTGTSKTTPSVSWNAGDVIVVLGATSDSGFTVTPTATGLTLVAGTPLAAASSCWANSWTCIPGSSGSSVFTATRSGGSALPYGIAVWVYRGSDGVGALAQDVSTTKTVSLTLRDDHSVVAEILADWSAAATTSHVWTPTGQTERQAQVVSGQYTVYVANWPDQGTAATTSYGITGTASTGAHSKIAVEVLGTITGTVITPADSPLVVTPPFAWPTIPQSSVSSSQPLGNPAIPTPAVEVVQPQFVWPAPIPGVQLFGPGAPAAAVVSAATPGPLVVTPAPLPVPVPPALIFAPTAVAVTPNATVVSPPFAPTPVPPVAITASQPLGNPAVGSPDPLVVGVPYTPVPVPGARLTSNPAAPVISTTSTPGPLVVGPPNLPVPIPRAIVTWSAPLGNPAVPTPGPLVVGPPPSPAPVLRVTITASSSTTFSAGPLVVTPPFAFAPVPGARVLAAPSAPTAPVVGTPGPLVITPSFIPVPIPRALFSANRPLGIPAVGSPQPLVVSPIFAWAPVVIPALLSGRADHTCSTARPSTGVTARPSSGTTLYATATTARPDTGVTVRPDTGTTDSPC